MVNISLRPSEHVSTYTSPASSSPLFLTRQADLLHASLYPKASLNIFERLKLKAAGRLDDPVTPQYVRSTIVVTAQHMQQLCSLLLKAQICAAIITSFRIYKYVCSTASPLFGYTRSRLQRVRDAS